jgi:hypothetical protein
LPILHFMVDGHLDALCFPFLLLTLGLWENRRHLGAMVTLGFSIMAKLFSGVFMAVLIRPAFRERKLLVWGIPLAMVIAAYVPYIAGSGVPFESLGIFSLNWSANGLIYKLAWPVVQNSLVLRLGLAALFLVWLGWLIWMDLPIRRACCLTVFGFFLLSPVVHPWYLTWLAVLLPLDFRWSGLAFVSLVNLASWVGVWHCLTNTWMEPEWLLPLEYGPVVVLIVAEFIRSRRPTELRSEGRFAP